MPQIATYNEGTLSFQTNPLTIDVGRYTGYYALGGHTLDFTIERGNVTAQLIPALEYHVTQSLNNGFSLQLDHLGHVSAVHNQDGDAVNDFGVYDQDSRTFSITTYPMAINMGAFSGRWNVYMVTEEYVEESGDLLINFIPSLDYLIGYGNGGKIQISLDSEGHIQNMTNADDESIDGVIAVYTSATRVLSIQSHEYVIISGSYSGTYHVNSIFAPYTYLDGDQSFHLIPWAKYTITVGWYGNFDIEIDSSGDVVAIFDEAGNPAGEIATYSSSTSDTGTSRTLTFQTVSMTIEVGNYAGRYSLFGVTGELQGDVDLDLLPSIEYGMGLGQGYASDNTFVFNLDNQGDIIETSPIAIYDPDTRVLSLSSHLVNIYSTCTQSYAINWVLDDTVGDAAIYLLSTVKYKLNVDGKTIEFGSDGTSLTVEGDGLMYADVSGSSMTLKSCLCTSSC